MEFKPGDLHEIDSDALQEDIDAAHLALVQAESIAEWKRRKLAELLELAASEEARKGQILFHRPTVYKLEDFRKADLIAEADALPPQEGKTEITQSAEQDKPETPPVTPGTARY